ncbi:MAG TPA: Gfo/Idh/MocA family oxidoreductase [Terriglobales bacterium]|nr:Gfo/Idh/MocA family oxidoreductase [Terriglobales bacterium]
MEAENLPVAVIGAGAFGRNHARVYHELQESGYPVELVAVVDTDLPRAQIVAAPFRALAFGSLGEALRSAKIDAASVAVPTDRHLEVARALMENSIDVLIEKPLAASLAQADEIAAIAKHTGRLVQVGHLERFNPAVRATLPLLTQPMFFEVHRLSVFSPRSLDVDVVLDLMIHDLDIVLAFVKSPVREIRAVGLPILSHKVDIANVRMEFESGCVANFTASRVSTERVRKLRFFQPRQYISIDYSRQEVLAFTVTAGPDSLIDSAQPAGSASRINSPSAAGTPAMAGQKFGPASAMLTGAAVLAQAGITFSKPAVEQQEPLRAELSSFLEAVRHRTQPEVSLAEGRRALEVALLVQSAIEEHAHRFDLRALQPGS